jgi:predicted small secreted protein
MKIVIKPAASFAFLAVAALLLSTLVLAACNTTKGAGKDIEAAGTGIKNAADRNGAK